MQWNTSLKHLAVQRNTHMEKIKRVFFIIKYVRQEQSGSVFLKNTLQKEIIFNRLNKSARFTSQQLTFSSAWFLDVVRSCARD